MGTFTIPYFLRGIWRNWKWYIGPSPVYIYLCLIFLSHFFIHSAINVWNLGHCYYQQCLGKRQMMKGQSRLYEDRRAEILAWDPHADIYKY